MPNCAITTLMSSEKQSKRALKPATPSAPNAKSAGRPIIAKSAPSANALTISSPLRIPLSNKRGKSDPTASLINGKSWIAGGTLSSCRPPWFETYIASAPRFFTRLASSVEVTPFTISFPGHFSRSNFKKSQFNKDKRSQSILDTSSHSLMVSAIKSAKLVE